VVFGCVSLVLSLCPCVWPCSYNKVAHRSQALVADQPAVQRAAGAKKGKAVVSTPKSKKGDDDDVPEDEDVIDAGDHDLDVEDDF
jgi:hypothetical protein